MREQDKAETEFDSVFRTGCTVCTDTWPYGLTRLNHLLSERSELCSHSGGADNHNSQLLAIETPPVSDRSSRPRFCFGRKGISFCYLCFADQAPAMNDCSTALKAEPSATAHNL